MPGCFITACPGLYDDWLGHCAADRCRKQVHKFGWQRSFIYKECEETVRQFKSISNGKHYVYNESQLLTTVLKSSWEITLPSSDASIIYYQYGPPACTELLCSTNDCIVTHLCASCDYICVFLCLTPPLSRVAITNDQLSIRGASSQAVQVSYILYCCICRLASSLHAPLATSR